MQAVAIGPAAAFGSWEQWRFSAAEMMAVSGVACGEKKMVAPAATARRKQPLERTWKSSLRKHDPPTTRKSRPQPRAAAKHGSAEKGKRAAASKSDAKQDKNEHKSGNGSGSSDGSDSKGSSSGSRLFRFTDTNEDKVRKLAGIVLDDEAQYEDDDFEDETHAEDELADQLEAALRKQECEGFLDATALRLTFRGQ